MKTNKHVLAAAVIAAIGMASAVNNASAAVVANGTYNLVINTTPVASNTSGTFYKFGKDGAWNSGFAFNFGGPPDGICCGMNDNNVSVTNYVSSPRGSSVGGDGWAGILGITVSGSSFTVNGVPSMGGTIDQTTGAMTLNPTGRLGAFSLFPLYDKRLNVDDCTYASTGCTNNGNTLWSTFSTTSATSTGTGGPITIHGAAVTGNGDVNVDGMTDYKAILVSAGQWGSEWGSLFGGGFFEMWNVQMLSTTSPHSGFNVDAILSTPFGDIVQYAPVPIPAAMWLFSSGLLGLAAVARRKRRRE